MASTLDEEHEEDIIYDKKGSKAWCWRHFGVNKDGTKAICKLCKKKYAYKGEVEQLSILLLEYNTCD